MTFNLLDVKLSLPKPRASQFPFCSFLIPARTNNLFLCLLIFPLPSEGRVNWEAGKAPFQAPTSCLEVNGEGLCSRSVGRESTGWWRKVSRGHGRDGTAWKNDPPLPGTVKVLPRPSPPPSRTSVDWPVEQFRFSVPRKRVPHRRQVRGAGAAPSSRCGSEYWRWETGRGSVVRVTEAAGWGRPGAGLGYTGARDWDSSRFLGSGAEPSGSGACWGLSAASRSRRPFKQSSFQKLDRFQKLIQLIQGSPICHPELFPSWHRILNILLHFPVVHGADGKALRLALWPPWLDATSCS